MAKLASRDFNMKKNGTVIASCRSKTLTINSTPIEVTNDDSDGIATFLADTFATDTMEITVDGYFEDDSPLWTAAISNTLSARHLSDITLVDAVSNDALSGNFIMTTYSKTGGGSDGAVEFSATLVRNGAHTWTPGP